MGAEVTKIPEVRNGSEKPHSIVINFLVLPLFLHPFLKYPQRKKEPLFIRLQTGENHYILLPSEELIRHRGPPVCIALPDPRPPFPRQAEAGQREDPGPRGLRNRGGVPITYATAIFQKGLTFKLCPF